MKNSNTVVAAVFATILLWVTASYLGDMPMAQNTSQQIKVAQIGLQVGK